MILRISVLLIVLLLSNESKLFCQLEIIKIKGGYKSCNVYRYDSKIEEKFNEKPKFKMYECKYDEKGNVIELIDYHDDIIQYKIVTKYDENGNIIEIINYGKDGDIEKRETNKYNANGKLIENNYYSDDDSLYRQEIYIYDDKDNIIEDCLFDKGVIFQRHIYKYDDYGNMIEDISFDQYNEPVCKDEFIYSK